MDLNSVYREHFLSLVGAKNAPTVAERATHRQAADRYSAIIERARFYGSGEMAA